MTKGSDVSSSTSSARVAPGLRARALARLTAGLAVVLLLAGTMARAQQAAEPAELVQARQLFDALDYEQALPLLDRAVAVLEPAGRPRSERAADADAAYGMRARARFGTATRTAPWPTSARRSRSIPVSRSARASRRASSRCSTK